MAWINPSSGIRKLRQQIHQSEAVPQLTLLGMLVGLATAALMIAFRTVIEWPLQILLPDHHENFEALPIYLRALFPIFGIGLLIILWNLIPPHARRVGVAHVIEKLNQSSGRMPGLNIVSQFIAGSLAILSGLSVGREGPAIHLGAGISSLMGQYIKLPNHSIQTLVGCGAAAAIAASFNTPIAGVIFAMEVILMEYTLAGFVPIIAAATTATVVTQLVYGTSPAFTVPEVSLGSLAELPFLILCGLIIGCFAALFNRLIRSFLAYQHLPIWKRFGFAGLVTVLLAMIAPEIMGTGYDTVTSALSGTTVLQVLIIVFCAKIIATACSIGLGIPAGLIGPTFILGATLGGILGTLSEMYMPWETSGPAFYATIGMGAMMSAVLAAPLAALMAVLELTSNSNILFPAMLTLVAANLTSQHLFKQPAIFSAILTAQGLNARSTPVAKAMRGMSALRMAITEFDLLPLQIELNQLQEHLKHSKQVVVRCNETENLYRLADSDYLRHCLSEELSRNKIEHKGREIIDLEPWLGAQFDMEVLPSHVTLEECLRAFQKHDHAGVVLALSPNSPPEGYISRQQLMSYIASLGEH